jgi:DNA-binding transcriptional regulator LsrR (DeoR family)
MHIAKMLNISERSVSRLMTKAKKQKIKKIDPEILETVSQLMGSEEAPAQEVIPETTSDNDSKKQTAMRLISMNVKVLFFQVLNILFYGLLHLF